MEVLPSGLISSALLLGAISVSAQSTTALPATLSETGLLDSLTRQFPNLIHLVTWIGLGKTVFHFIEIRLQNWAALKLVEIVDSPDPNDDHLLLSLLDARWYRFTQFIAKLFSLPLPTRADYELALAKKSHEHNS